MASSLSSDFSSSESCPNSKRQSESPAPSCTLKSQGLQRIEDFILWIGGKRSVFPSGIGSGVRPMMASWFFERHLPKAGATYVPPHTSSLTRVDQCPTAPKKSRTKDHRSSTNRKCSSGAISISWPKLRTAATCIPHSEKTPSQPSGDVKLYGTGMLSFSTLL